ncbi:MAG: helix-turn-helix domain-containing protein, partial [Alphaproteobacteria bacterium]
FGPGDPDRNKGWVDRWLAGKVAITLPEPPPELSPSQFRAIRRRRFSPKRMRRQAAKRPAETLDGARVRRTRVERSWSQATLARHLGVSASYLSQIETGKRHPSATVAAKLTAWVEPGANGGSEARWSE